MALEYTRAEVKERARADWIGACNVTLPSFTAEFTRLNENGIAHDVRLAAEYGFWGTLVAAESGTSVDEYIRFLEVARDAAPKGFSVVAHLSFSTLDESLRVAAAAQSIGAEAALLSYPPGFTPRTPGELVELTRHVAQRTDLALILFAVMTWGFRYLHPSGFPPDALEEMAKIDTVASIKYEVGGPTMDSCFEDAFRRCSAHALVQNPMEQHMPALSAKYGARWFGTSGYEAFGDRVPRVLEALRDGRWDDAMKTFWSYQAGREAKGAFHATFGGANLIHRVGWKYLGWLQGFNGGLLRMPQMRLLPGQMKALRNGLAASGFDLPDTDDGFYAGRHS